MAWQQAESVGAIQISRIASGTQKGQPSFGSPTCDAPIWCAASAGREARPRPSTAKPGCSSKPEKRRGRSAGHERCMSHAYLDTCQALSCCCLEIQQAGLGVAKLGGGPPTPPASHLREQLLERRRQDTLEVAQVAAVPHQRTPAALQNLLCLRGGGAQRTAVERFVGKRRTYLRNDAGLKGDGLACTMALAAAHQPVCSWTPY